MTTPPFRKDVVVAPMPGGDGFDWVGDGLLEDPLIFTVTGAIEQLSEGRCG
jgi:hypothetical protein